MVQDPQHTASTLLPLLRAWRKDKAQQRCPECGATRLQVKDLSARPHTEWYRFTCSDCGLNETIALPQASSGPKGIS